MKECYYQAHIIWAGNQGTGTSGYREYLRDYEINIDSKSIIKGSSDPAFRGNPTLHNPEKLFLASLSFCHMLWFLHLCSQEGIRVLEYQDKADGVMQEKKDGACRPFQKSNFATSSYCVKGTNGSKSKFHSC